MNKYFQGSYSTRLVLLLAVILFIGLVVSNINHKIFIENEFSRQVQVNLRQIAAQTDYFIEYEILRREKILNHLTSKIAEIFPEWKKNATKQLVSIAQQYNFKRTGIIYDNGIGINNEETKIDFNGDQEYLLAKNTGKQTISDTFRDKNGETSVRYFVPLKDGKNGQTKTVFFAAMDLAVIQQYIPNFIFENKNDFYLIERDGDILTTSVEEIQKEGAYHQNLFNILFAAEMGNRDIVNELIVKIANGESGFIKFENKIEKYLYYYPSRINDWYICSVIPTNQMGALKKAIIHYNNNFLKTNLAIFLFLVTIILYILIKAKKTIFELAYTDQLTGGISLRKFTLDATKTITDNINTKNMALISMNIDDFKSYSNIVSKEESDKFLKFIWKAIDDRKTDTELHTRSYADQFYLLVFFNSEQELIDRITILHDIIDNYKNKDIEYHPRTSFGIYIIPNKLPEFTTIIDNANIALRTARTTQEYFYSFFDPKIKLKSDMKSTIEKEMFTALNNNEFKIFYQPIFNMDTNKIIAAEAIVRWIKKDGTEVPQDVFMPIFEKNFFITNINKYVFTNICRQHKIWEKSKIKGVPLSLTISKQNFYNPNFVNNVKKILIEYMVHPSKILMDITEGDYKGDLSTLCNVINELKNSGISISMHLFGPGYSSSEVLQKTSVDMIKFNKRFVGDLENIKNRKIITSLLQIIKTLNMKSACDGIDNTEQYEFLKVSGCNIGQGGYFSEVLTVAELEDLIDSCYSQDNQNI